MEIDHEHVSLPFWARGRNGVLLAEVPLRAGGRLPSFLVIGAAKAGTTSLRHYLARHPEISMCSYEEPHFFSSDPIHARGLEWYKGLFAGIDRERVCGEASTSYSRCPQTRDAPRRIHQCIPDAKLIYLVREPVARIESECMQVLKYERYVLDEHVLPTSIDTLVDCHPQLIRSSEYIEQIESYLQYFARDQLLVILQEDLARAPRETLARIFRFLEVDPHPDIDTSTRHDRAETFTRRLVNARAGELAPRMPALDRLARLIPPSLKQRIEHVATVLVDMSRIIRPMSPACIATLKSHFRPFNRRLAAYIGRDLSHWDQRSRR